MVFNIHQNPLNKWALTLLLEVYLCSQLWRCVWTFPPKICVVSHPQKYTEDGAYCVHHGLPCVSAFYEQWAWRLLFFNASFNMLLKVHLCSQLWHRCTCVNLFWQSSCHRSHYLSQGSLFDRGPLSQGRYLTECPCHRVVIWQKAPVTGVVINLLPELKPFIRGATRRDRLCIQGSKEEDRFSEKYNSHKNYRSNLQLRFLSLLPKSFRVSSFKK